MTSYFTRSTSTNKYVNHKIMIIDTSVSFCLQTFDFDNFQHFEDFTHKHHGWWCTSCINTSLLSNHVMKSSCFQILLLRLVLSHQHLIFTFNIHFWFFLFKLRSRKRSVKQYKCWNWSKKSKLKQVLFMKLTDFSDTNEFHLNIQIECRICYFNLSALWFVYFFCVCKTLIKWLHFDWIIQFVRFTERNVVDSCLNTFIRFNYFAKNVNC